MSTGHRAPGEMHGSLPDGRSPTPQPEPGARQAPGPAGDAELQQPLHALLALVDEDRERQCKAVLDEARAQAAAVRRSARDLALVRVRQTFAEQRQGLASRLGAARAQLATRQRLQEQQHSAALLALCWQQLPSALLARWQDADARAAWVDQVLQQAQRHLPRAGWVLAHGPGWPEAERDAACRSLAGKGHTGLQCHADPAIAAGLCVTAAGNRVDGTLAGLLADRAAVEAALLRLWEQTA